MTAQRREELKKYMLEHKSASVLDMAQRFQVSGQTIRRDFEALEKEGFLLRSYGGAMVKDRKTDFVPNTVKSELFVDEKKAICRRAVSQIYPNDCIFIDHSYIYVINVNNPIIIVFFCKTQTFFLNLLYVFIYLITYTLITLKYNQHFTVI